MKKETGIVKHHNYVNESIFKFNNLELNIFISIIYRLQNSNEVLFRAKDIKKYSGSKERSYERFAMTLKKLQKQSMELKTKNGYKSIMPFPTLDFNLKEKSIAVEVHKELLPLLENIKKQFTLYSIDEFISLESKYSKRFFQLLKQYESIGKRTFKLEYLKELLMTDYDRFYDFEKNVLKKSTEEINKLTSLNISYKKNKIGRSISSIEFMISKKKSKTEGEYPRLETRKEVIAKALKSFDVQYIKELTDVQKKLLNITLKGKNFNGVR